MHVTVRFFASHREATGQTAFRADVPADASVSDVLDLVVDRFPALKPLCGGVAFAVNQSLVPAQTVLCDGDELAFLPPMAGG
jgi:molybdopterin converting factor subunit 1